MNNTILIDSINIQPLGSIWVASTTQGLIALHVGDQRGCSSLIKKLTDKEPILAPDKLNSITDQLTAYFNKERAHFDVTIDWSYIKPFQKSVLQRLLTIPYGQTRTYSDIAQNINKPKAARAVGTAIAQNPMPLIIPCHRVIRTDGSLGGYSVEGGLTTKTWLLTLENSTHTI